MSSTLALATDLIFQDTSLDLAALDNNLSILRAPQIDGGELYFQSSNQEQFFCKTIHA